MRLFSRTLVFRFTVHEDAAHFLRLVSPVYHRLIAGLTILPALLLLPGGSYTVKIMTLLAVAVAAIAADRILVSAVKNAREAGSTARF